LVLVADLKLPMVLTDLTLQLPSGVPERKRSQKLATIRTRSLAYTLPCWSRIILQNILPPLGNFDIQ
jgi:hypothetical protein